MTSAHWVLSKSLILVLSLVAHAVHDGLSPANRWLASAGRGGIQATDWHTEQSSFSSQSRADAGLVIKAVNGNGNGIGNEILQCLSKAPNSNSNNTYYAKRVYKEGQ